MRRLIVIVSAFVIMSVAAGAANAATKKKDDPGVQRSAAGTIIQPTRTIIHNADGSTTVIVVHRRSYLDTGTEVTPGDRKFLDYAFPAGGDPGRPYWFYGPDKSGSGWMPLPPPLYIPGWNPNVP
jgi:hypothetical protein